MKLGTIKVEALKIMFVNYAADFNIDQLEDIASDDLYSSYMAGMTGAINRCFAAIENKKVLPIKILRLCRCKGESTKMFTRWKISELCEDFLAVCRVVRETDSSYIANADYRLEGDVIVLSDVADNEYIALLYYPSIERITNGTDNNKELDIPENIAVAIPYYVKGDLFRDDEPAEAGEARNWFEAAMDEIIANRNTVHQSVVDTKYRME